MKTIFVGMAVALAGLPVPAWAQAEPDTRRVSVARFNLNRTGRSQGCDVASGGRAVAFESAAPSLVRDDTNRTQDVFLWRDGKKMERVSVTSGEKQARTYTSHPSVSSDGRVVAFDAESYRLTRDDGSARTVFVRDVAKGRTERASVRSDGGRVRGGSSGAALSHDGMVVAFTSSAKDLAPKGDDNDVVDVFVHERAGGNTNRVSLSRDLGDPDGYSEAPAISRDGRFVAYASYAANVVRRDGNDAKDVFVYDRRRKTGERVSISSDGTEGQFASEDPAVSADGRYVSFHSYERFDEADVNDAIDVYVHDRVAGTTELVSKGPAGVGDADSDSSSISADGRYVAFLSDADNLVAGDTNGTQGAGRDVFVYDRVEGDTTRVNVGDDGEQGTHATQDAEISPDGAYVCWSTASTNLDENDHNNTTDVYLRGPLWDE